MKKQVIACIALAAMMVVGMASCEGKMEEGEDINVAAVQNTNLNTNSSNDSVMTIGQGTSSITLKNKCGQAVSNVAVKNSTDSVFGSGLLSAGKKWDANKTAQINFTLTAPEQTGDVAIAAMADIQLTLADGSVKTLHQINPATLSKVSDLSLCLDSATGLVYLSYTSGTSQATTLEAEKAIADAQAVAAQAAAEALAAEQAAADEDATVTETEEESISSDGSYTYTYTYSTSGSSSSSDSDSSSSGSSVNQSGDQCVTPAFRNS